jgi:hypothetical protein
MIDLFVNRIKDAYFDLTRDQARGERFYEMSQAFTPGAIQRSPSQMAQMQQFPPNTPLGPQPQMGTPDVMGAPAAPAPMPSMLDLIGARR